MTSQLVIFRAFFLSFFFIHLKSFYFAFLISPEQTVKLVKLTSTGQFFNSVTLKNTQTEPQKYTIFFIETK